MADRVWFVHKVQNFGKNQEEQGLYYKVKMALAKGNERALYELLPTTEDFCTFRDFNEGTILHLILEEKSFRCNDVFLSRIIGHYFPKDADDKTLQIRKDLLLTRNIHGRLAANYQFAKDYFPKINWQGQKKKLALENNSSRKYHLLKKWIKDATPIPTEDEIHPIADKPNPRSSYEEGRPVSSIPLFNEQTGFFEVEECFPTISLYRVPTVKDGPSEVVTVKDIPINSLEANEQNDIGALFVETVIKRLDFPEDWQDYYPALYRFAHAYMNIRKEEEREFAALRSFIKERGTIIFEDKKEPESKGNSREDGDYSAYADTRQHTKTGEKYAFIVIRIEDLDATTLLHELFHHVDLDIGVVFSEQDIAKIALMLTQTDLDKQSERIEAEDFKTVEKVYPPSEYEKEMLARIMERPLEAYEGNELFHRIYQLAILLAKSKVDDIYAIQNRIKFSGYKLPNRKELIKAYAEFIDMKWNKEAMLNEHKDKPIPELEIEKINELIALQMKEFIARHSDLLNQARIDLGQALFELVRDTTALTAPNIPLKAKQVSLPPILIEAFSEQNNLPAEVNFIARIEEIRKNPFNNKDVYLARMASPNFSDENFFLYRYLYAIETGQLDTYFNEQALANLKIIRTRVAEDYKKLQRQRELFAKYYPNQVEPFWISFFDVALDIEYKRTFYFLDNAFLLDEKRGKNALNPKIFEIISGNFRYYITNYYEFAKPQANKEGLTVSVTKPSPAYVLAKMEYLQKMHKQLCPQKPIPERLWISSLMPEDLNFNVEKQGYKISLELQEIAQNLQKIKEAKEETEAAIAISPLKARQNDRTLEAASQNITRNIDKRILLIQEKQHER